LSIRQVSRSTSQFFHVGVIPHRCCHGCILEIVSREDPHVRPRSLDVPTIAGVAAGGIALVVALVYLRFCGAVSVPPKPAAPHFNDTAAHVVKKLDATTDVYVQGLTRDALRAGITAPTLDDMERALVWTEDASRRTLAPGGAPIETAGLRISAIVTKLAGSEDLLALVVENPGSSAVAYDVETEVSSNNAACVNRTVIPHNGTVIAAGARETRSECSWKRGMELYVTRVESAPLAPMEAYYLSLVSPQALGESDRMAVGHRPSLPSGVQTCAASMSQSVRRAIEDGRTRWRDLADFFARHPCATYEFPDGYRAFEKDGEQSLPVTGN
jgi:hypothetical protein